MKKGWLLHKIMIVNKPQNPQWTTSTGSSERFCHGPHNPLTITSGPFPFSYFETVKDRNKKSNLTYNVKEICHL